MTEACDPDSSTEAARRFIKQEYCQDPGSASDLYDAADMANAFKAGANWADGIRQGG